MKLVTLRKRREFLRVRGGGRWSTPAFVLEAKLRNDTKPSLPASAEQAFTGPRFGFTVTKRLGNAVRRNRIRRRLKAAVSEVAKVAARDHFDYVLVARDAAHDLDFASLISELKIAFERVHRPAQKQPIRRQRQAKPGSAHN